MLRRSLFLLGILLFVASTVWAQEPTALDQLHIGLWAEYDDPRLLVIIDGKLTQPGQTVRVPVPRAAEINAVAAGDSNANLLNAAWEASLGDETHQIITIDNPDAVFRVEYYIPLAANDVQRVIDFSLPPGYFSAANADIEILLPPPAADIANTPDLDRSDTTPGSVQIFKRQLGAVAGEQGIAQTVSYSNPTGALSLPEDARPVATPVAQPPPAAPAATTSGRTLLFWLLAIAAIVLIVVGVYSLWRIRRQDLADSPPPPPTRLPNKRSTAPPSDIDQFCRNCGVNFDADDRFCRQCGSPRTTPSSRQ